MANTMIVDRNWWTAEDGANEVDFIRENEDLTPRGPHHAPISSADILTRFREKAKSFGLELVNEKCGLLKRKEKKGEIVGGNRFMYVAEVKDDSRPDYALSVGFRNFGDKSLSFQGMCGNSIFICKNGVCSSVIKPSKMRHTIGNVGNGYTLDSKIDTIFRRFAEDKDAIHGQIELMKSTPITDELVGKFVRAMTKTPVGRSAIGQMIEVMDNPMKMIMDEMENPTVNLTTDNSMFRLMNAGSFITTHHIHNPSRAMQMSHIINDTIMRVIKPDFTPLGDVVEVEEVESAD